MELPQAWAQLQQLNSILGGSVLLSAALPPNKTVKEIEWSFSAGAGATIQVAEFGPGGFERPDPKDRFKDRLEMFNETALRIRALERGDSGVYGARIKLHPAPVEDQAFSLAVSGERLRRVGWRSPKFSRFGTKRRRGRPSASGVGNRFLPVCPSLRPCQVTICGHVELNSKQNDVVFLPASKRGPCPPTRPGLSAARHRPRAGAPLPSPRHAGCPSLAEWQLPSRGR